MMTQMMMAKCFAKGCHQKATAKEMIKDFKKWRPCGGCRSQWIHVACGGFCSDCQPVGGGGGETNVVKSSSSTVQKRSADRSPLSIKQSQIAKRLQDSTGFREGKENSSGSLGAKRQRKPVAPPSLTPEAKSDNNNSQQTSKKLAPPEKQQLTIANNRKRKISHGASEPVAKKAKKISTAPGGTPKKYASEPHAKLKPAKKVVVEVKMAEDGTHNPDRLIYHVKNNQPIDKGEVEAEECYNWLKDMSQRQIDEFVDLNGGEKAFFKLWNTHLHENPCYGDNMLLDILDMFIDAHGVQIYRRQLYKNFMLHLSSLHSFGAISSVSMMTMITKYQTLIKDVLENPDQYPLTPEKKIIDNPYYVPKPVTPESLKTHRHSSTSKSIIISAPSSKKNSKSFWLKKRFLNPVQGLNEVADPDLDLDRWPRKKATVHFANEVFIDEIRDLNQKSGSSNLAHDVADLYKYLSPRQRRHGTGKS